MVKDGPRRGQSWRALPVDSTHPYRSARAFDIHRACCMGRCLPHRHGDTDEDWVDAATKLCRIPPSPELRRLALGQRSSLRGGVANQG